MKESRTISDTMTDAEFVAMLEESNKKRRAEQLEARAERNLKIDMLAKMSKEVVGEAYICYTNAMKDVEDVEITSDAVLEAYLLICDIEHLDFWEC